MKDLSKKGDMGFDLYESPEQKILRTANYIVSSIKQGKTKLEVLKELGISEEEYIKNYHTEVQKLSIPN